MTSHHTISSITKYTRYHHKAYILSPKQQNKKNFDWRRKIQAQALVSFKKYMPPPLPYFKVNICPLPLPHFASIFFAYLWSFRWSNYIVTLPRYFSFRLLHLNINTGPPSDELDKNIQRKSHFLIFSQWNGYNHFRFALDFSYAFGIL
jgi:hypothetical protein